jgi:iron complex outermembrane receptor protein
MTPSKSRAALSLGLISGLVIGCASSQRGTSATTPPGVVEDSGKITDPIQLLRARAPGLLVNRTPDGGISVQILRGASSFTNEQPLYILDGAPFSPGPNGALTGISPYDIESLRVLTRPEDIAVYGQRARNGVILIKTRRPGS